MTKNEKRQLPKGWRWEKLKNETTNNISLFKKDIFVEGIFKYIDISSIDNVTKRIIGYQEIPVNDAPSRAKYILEENDIIVATVRPNLNAVAIIDQQYAGCVGSSGFCVVRLRSGHHPKYFFQYLTSPYFVDAVSDMVQGAMYPAINNRDVLNFDIPLPPALDDQIIIANKLERKMVEIETMRQAALRQKEASDALAGGILRDFFPVKSGETLPKGWRWVKLENLCEIVNGFGFPKHLQGQKKMPYPYIKVSDMNHVDSQVIMLKAENYVDENILSSIGATVYPAGTVIFPKVGGALLTNKKRMLGVEATFDNNIMGLISKSNTNSKYIYYWISSIDLADIANTQALPSIRKSDIANLKIPLPPALDDQIIIANKLERKMTEIEAMRQAALRQKEAVEAMPGAILREVFDFGKN